MRKEILKKKAIKWCNTYYECDDYIILNCSKEETEESYDILIDKDDFELVSKGQWLIYNPRKNSNRKDIYQILWTKMINGKKINYEIYQLIMGTKLKDNIVVDHINTNRFDNRKENLRIVTPQINSINQYPKLLNNKIKDRKGYYYDKKNNKFLARIRINGKMFNIGRYNTEIEAETLYLKANIIIENDKISTYLQERIKELNINVTDEEIKLNRYLYKVYCLYNNIEVPKESNGKLNLAYIKNMDVICNLKEIGHSWKMIAQYLVENNLAKKAYSETVKKYYNQYLETNKL